MKIDMTQVLPGMDGEPMQTDGLRVECPECKHVIKVEEREPLTLKRVCLRALNVTAPPTQQNPVGGNTKDRKDRQGEILVAILVAEKPELKSEQVTIIKEMLGMSEWRPWVAYIAGLMLEGQPLPEIPAAEDQGKEPSPPAKT